MKRGCDILYFYRARRSDGLSRVAESVRSDYEISMYRPRGGEKQYVEPLFSVVDALIFVGACGIAVRAIAHRL